MSQIEWIYDQLQTLSAETLVKIIDELGCGIQDDYYKEMSLDIYRRVKNGYSITDKQKRVLVNVFCQRRI